MGVVHPQLAVHTTLDVHRRPLWAKIPILDSQYTKGVTSGNARGTREVRPRSVVVTLGARPLLSESETYSPAVSLKSRRPQRRRCQYDCFRFIYHRNRHGVGLRLVEGRLCGRGGGLQFSEGSPMLLCLRKVLEPGARSAEVCTLRGLRSTPFYLSPRGPGPGLGCVHLAIIAEHQLTAGKWEDKRNPPYGCSLL
jgi:hypothetical protein